MQFKALMNCKNSDGVTALKILQNGALRKHYEGLQNSSRLFARLGPKDVRLGTGTARNEQLHHELKSRLWNIIMSHQDRLQNGFRIFILAQLLAHFSASEFPTLTQTSQSRLLSVMAGKLRVNGFFATPINPVLSTSLSTRLGTIFISMLFHIIQVLTLPESENVNWKKLCGEKENLLQVFVFATAPMISLVLGWTIAIVHFRRTQQLIHDV